MNNAKYKAVDHGLTLRGSTSVIAPCLFKRCQEKQRLSTTSYELPSGAHKSLLSAGALGAAGERPRGADCSLLVFFFSVCISSPLHVSLHVFLEARNAVEGAGPVPALPQTPGLGGKQEVMGESAS